MSTAHISVVIRTLNSASTLPLVIGGLKFKGDDELIIVDSGSADSTLEQAKRAGANILHIPQQEFTYGRALNLGFQAARNDWVLALSSHCIPMPVRDDHLQLFREAVRRYPNAFVAAAGPFHHSEWDRLLHGGITFYELADFQRGFGFPAGNPNCLYRRSSWQEHPFDEQLPTGEDYEWYVWALKRGLTIAAVHAASARYATERPMRVLYARGKLDRRQNAALLNVPPLRTRELCIQTARLVAYWGLGRMSLASARNGIAYKLGEWIESRAPNRSATVERR